MTPIEGIRVDRVERGARVSWQRLLAFGDQHPWLLFGSTLVWLPVAIVAAETQRLWFDELMTLYLSRLSDSAALLKALRLGVDLQPPFFFWVTRVFESWLGYGELGSRAEAIVFFGLFTITTFEVARRTMGIWYGWMAVWLVLCSSAFPYSHEARPYAMLLAFASLSLLFWICYREKPTTWALIGLAASVAATVSSHYYGVFAICPILAGEAAQWYETRRVPYKTLLALASGVAPLVLVISVVKEAVAVRGGSTWNPATLSSAKEIYEGLWFPAAVPLLCAWTVWSLRWHHVDVSKAAQPPKPIPTLTIASIGYIVTPLLAVAIARFFANMIHWRYLLPCVIGSVMICAYGLYRAARGTREPAALVAVCCACWFLYTNINAYRSLAGHVLPPDRLVIPVALTDEPVFINSPFDYVSYYQYCAPELQGRLFYVGDRKLAERHIRTDAYDLNVIKAAPFFSFNVIDFKQLRAKYREFLVYDGRTKGGWLLAELTDDGARIEVAARVGNNFLYRIHF